MRRSPRRSGDRCGDVLVGRQPCECDRSCGHAVYRTDLGKTIDRVSWTAGLNNSSNPSGRNASRVPSAGGSPRRYFPVSTPRASGADAVNASLCSAHRARTSAPWSGPEQAVAVLHVLEPVTPSRSGSVERSCSSSSRLLADADAIASARLTDCFQRFERHRHRRGGIGRVDEQPVDPIDAEPFKTAGEDRLDERDRRRRLGPRCRPARPWS